MPAKVVFYIKKHRGETDATISEDEGNKSEIHYSRLPKDIGSFAENIKNAFTIEFLSAILAKIDDLTIDINETILCVVDTLKNAAIPQIRKVRSKIQQIWFDKECESLKYS